MISTYLCTNTYQVFFHILSLIGVLFCCTGIFFGYKEYKITNDKTQSYIAISLGVLSIIIIAVGDLGNIFLKACL